MKFKYIESNKWQNNKDPEKRVNIEVDLENAVKELASKGFTVIDVQYQEIPKQPEIHQNLPSISALIKYQ